MKRNKLLKILYIGIVLIFLIVISLFLVRFFNEKYLDDVSPEIRCEEYLLKNSDIFFVIPKFNNFSIADSQEWCERIKGYNKELALHGVYHTYREFGESRSEDYLQDGLDAFVDCFGFYPEKFKAPQLIFSQKNKIFLNINRLELISRFDQITHKTYHCGDTGLFSNNFHRLF